MNDAQRLQLQNMIKANNVEDQTNLIRTLKHSDLLKSDINSLIFLKAKYRKEPEKINEVALIECNFLFSYYTDIYNRILKKELDISILQKFLGVLEKIENGEIGQHEGSYLVGQTLKELYIDSALKKAEKLDKEGEKPVEPKKPSVNVSWKEFKKTNISL